MKPFFPALARILEEPRFEQGGRRSDRKLLMLALSGTFRRCWVTFGRSQLEHDFLCADVRVAEFHHYPTDRFLHCAHSNADLTTEQKDRINFVRTLTPEHVYRIVLTSAAAPGDRRHVIERELHVVGHPRVRGALQYTESYMVT